MSWRTRFGGTLALVSALSLLAVVLQAQSGASTRVTRAGQGSDLFQKALSKERVDGQFAEAIVLYERIVTDFAADRALVAKALVQMGRCYERLGKAEARSAYDRVVREFADQPSAADEARVRLAALGPASVVPSTRQVWTGPGVGPFGAPSPDGRLLSFVDWESGNPAVFELSSGATRRLTADAREKGRFAEFSIFSPDSRQVAFGTLNFASGATGYELWIAGADGSNPRRVYGSPETTFIQPFAWMPAGRQILAALSNTVGATQLALVSTETGTSRVLKTFDWRGVVKATVSPDGAWIAFDAPAGDDTEARDVHLLAADGSRQATLVAHAANDFFPMWTPDGQSVVFLSDRSGGMAAWIQAVSAGKPVGVARLLKADMRGALPLGFGARGSLYYSQDPQTDIYVATIDPDSGAVVAPAARASEHLVGANTAPDWSADGTQLVYVSRRLELPKAQLVGGRILCVLDVASGQIRELTPPLASIDRPRWSPDARSILVQAQQNGRYGLYRIDAATGGVTRLVQLEPATGLNGAVWSRDGAAVFYITYGTGSIADVKQPVIRLDLQSGREQILDATSGSKSDLALSRDGRWLAYRAMKPSGGAGPPASAIRIAPVDGGPSRDLDGVPIAAYRGLNWTANDRFLMFATANAGERRYEMARILAPGGRHERIAQGLTLEGMFLDARLHPDGRRLAFRSGAGAGTGEIWVMENFLPVARKSATRRQSGGS